MQPYLHRDSPAVSWLSQAYAYFNTETRAASKLYSCICAALNDLKACPWDCVIIPLRVRAGLPHNHKPACTQRPYLAFDWGNNEVPCECAGSIQRLQTHKATKLACEQSHKPNRKSNSSRDRTSLACSERGKGKPASYLQLLPHWLLRRIVKSRNISCTSYVVGRKNSSNEAP